MSFTEPPSIKLDMTRVRVIRIIEYDGPRHWVEATVAKSIQGSREVGPDRFIRAATLGTYPEIIEPAASI